MLVIKADTEFIKSIAIELRNELEALGNMVEKLYKTSNCIQEQEGFGANRLAEEISAEIKRIERVGSDISQLANKAEIASDIYRQAENKVRKDVERLPVLMHGNIAVKDKVSDYFITSQRVLDSEISDNSLLCDNAVMHEDWLIKLIAKKYYGG